MKILITGGLGNLGIWLTYHFLSAGYDVTVISRTEKMKIQEKKYTFISADVTDRASLSDAIDRYYDVCIHTASLNEHFVDNYSELALQVNALGTENLCRSLMKHGVGKLVYLSTFHVYGQSEGTVTEQSAILPTNDYGLTHYFAEKYIEKNARNSGLEYVIFRLTNSYGCPRDRHTDKWYLVLNDLCYQAFKHKSIILKSNGKVLRDFIWMGDVVQIIEKSLTSPDCKNDYYNLSSGSSVTILQVAGYVQAAFHALFQENIEIIVNGEDVSEYTALTVCNEKLIGLIPYTFSDLFQSEATKILTMLSEG